MLDEPTEGIQPSIIKDIGRAIQYLRDSTGMAILLVEQYLDFCRELADHVYIMDRGEIVHEGPAETLDTQDAAGTSTFDRASHAHSHDLCSSRECRQPACSFSAAPAAPMAEAQRIGRPQRAWGRGRLVAKPLAGRTRLQEFYQEGCAKIRLPEMFDGDGGGADQQFRRADRRRSDGLALRGGQERI